MNNDELKKKIVGIVSNILLSKIMKGKYILKDGDIERIADALIAAGIGDVKEVNRELTRIEVLKRERFAEEHGFTPDCTPYYIAEQYKHRAGVAERALEKACECIANTFNPYGKRDFFKQSYVKEYKYQAEKELSEERE